MVRMLKRHVIAAAGAVVVLAAGVGIAVAQVGGGDQPPETVERTLPPGATLEEIARAASGRPGQPLPPCPTEANVDRMKDAGIAVGPCDPNPEDGQTVLPRPTAPAPVESDDEFCYGAAIRMGEAPGESKLELPCVDAPADMPAFARALDQQLAPLPAVADTVILEDVVQQVPPDLKDDLMRALPPDLAERARGVGAGG
jgi:hypothetical protein